MRSSIDDTRFPLAFHDRGFSFKSLVFLTMWVVLPVGSIPCLAASPAPAPTQRPVWGNAGESWNRDLLLDWSFSGYANKERLSYPDPPFAANVLDFGALGDGQTDSSDAFRAAIGQVSDTGGGTVLIPRGRYLITKRLVMNKSNVVLKGEGNDTVLYFPLALSEVDGVDVEKHIASVTCKVRTRGRTDSSRSLGLIRGADMGAPRARPAGSCATPRWASAT